MMPPEPARPNLARLRAVAAGFRAFDTQEIEDLRRLLIEQEALRAALELIADGTRIQREQWCIRNGCEQGMAGDNPQASMVRIARAALHAATAPAAPGWTEHVG